MHRALERQRAGLGAHDGEPGRLGDQAGVEAVVALERRERPEAAVLLRRHALSSTTSGVGVPAARSAARACSAAITPPFMSTAPAPVHAAVGDRARPRPVAPRLVPGGDDVDVPVQRTAAPAASRAA